jgi:hypothetical protein
MSDHLLEEIEVLLSIFGSDQVQYSADDSSVVKYRDEDRDIVLTFIIPPFYPNDNGSIKFAINSIRCKIAIKNNIENCIEKILREVKNEVVLFRIIEAVKDLIDNQEGCVETDGDVQKHDSDVNTTPDLVLLDCNLKIIHGPSTTEMKSVFQSHIAAVASLADVLMFRAKVLENKKVNYIFVVPPHCRQFFSRRIYLHNRLRERPIIYLLIASHVKVQESFTMIMMTMVKLPLDLVWQKWSV